MNELAIQTALAGVVAKIVRYYLRRCRWADADDLRQEAWVAANAARNGWRAEVGPIEPYAARCIRRALGKYLLAESAPVSSSWKDRAKLVGLRRADLDGTPEAPCERNWADELLDETRWRVRVHARLLDIAGEDGLAALLGETKRVGRTPRWFLDSLEETRERLSRDPHLEALWRERGDDL